MNVVQSICEHRQLVRAIGSNGLMSPIEGKQYDPTCIQRKRQKRGVFL